MRLEPRADPGLRAAPDAVEDGNRAGPRPAGCDRVGSQHGVDARSPQILGVIGADAPAGPRGPRAPRLPSPTAKLARRRGPDLDQIADRPQPSRALSKRGYAHANPGHPRDGALPLDHVTAGSDGVADERRDLGPVDRFAACGADPGAEQTSTPASNASRGWPAESPTKGTMQPPPLPPTPPHRHSSKPAMSAASATWRG